MPELTQEQRQEVLSYLEAARPEAWRALMRYMAPTLARDDLGLLLAALHNRALQGCQVPSEFPGAMARLLAQIGLRLATEAPDESA